MKKIALNNDEKEIFDFLLKIKSSCSIDFSIRVAGGWVRDKILNISNEDIDIMIDNISVSEFLDILLNVDKNIKCFVSKENPEASKHLDTGNFTYTSSTGKNHSIDIAMARKEIYFENTRIPSVSPANPEEDAHRRDFTINSLFYNIETKQIEDFTKKGLVHLNSKRIIIDTPVDPVITFQEDPLRVLRAIRFCSRYNGILSERIIDALKNEVILERLVTIVSRERINEEIYKVLDKPYFVRYFTNLSARGIISYFLKTIGIEKNVYYFNAFHYPQKINDSRYNLLQLLILSIWDKNISNENYIKFSISFLDFLKISKKDKNYCLGILENVLKHIEPFRVPESKAFNEMVCFCRKNNIEIEDVHNVLRFLTFRSLSRVEFSNLDKQFKVAEEKMKKFNYSYPISGFEIMKEFPNLTSRSIGGFKEMAFDIFLSKPELSKLEIIEELKNINKEI